MSQDEASDPPPYTGRTPAVASEALVAEPSGGTLDGPRVRWRRITLVHLLAGALVGFALPAFFLLASSMMTFQVTGWIPLLLISSLVVALLGGLPLLAAWITWLLVSRRRRGLGREVAAVAGGALIGSLPVGLLANAFFNSWQAVLIVEGVLGVPCAIGFAIWVLVAWRRTPADTETPADSLN